MVVFCFVCSGLARLKSCAICDDSTNESSHRRPTSPQVEFHMHVAQNWMWLHDVRSARADAAYLGGAQWNGAQT